MPANDEFNLHYAGVKAEVKNPGPPLPSFEELAVHIEKKPKSVKKEIEDAACALKYKTI